MALDHVIGSMSMVIFWGSIKRTAAHQPQSLATGALSLQRAVLDRVCNSRLKILVELFGGQLSLQSVR